MTILFPKILTTSRASLFFPKRGDSWAEELFQGSRHGEERSHLVIQSAAPNATRELLLFASYTHRNDVNFLKFSQEIVVFSVINLPESTILAIQSANNEMEKGGAIYILTNKYNRVLYTGVTSNLFNRITEHRTHKYPKSFTAKYNVNRLVYFEGFHSIEEAILREKQLKAGSRKTKVALIEGLNPEWNDLFEEIKLW